jgi:hypothetical protein
MSDKNITLQTQTNKSNLMKTTNPMAEANVVIIDTLKKFMSEATSVPSVKARYCNFADKDFTRNRVLTFSTLVFLLLNTVKRSLSIELQHFFECFSNGLTCSKQAFSAQHSKLNPVFFHDWNQVLVDQFYQQYGDRVKTWKGKRLLAMDGSSLVLPDTEELRKQFGSASNDKGDTSPIARVCVLYDVLNGINIKGMLHPYFVSEEEINKSKRTL